MPIAPTLRISGTILLALHVAECTGWFGHALPLTGSTAGEIAFVLGGTFVLYELGDQTHSLRASLWAVWRRWWDRGSSGKGSAADGGQ